MIDPVGSVSSQNAQISGVPGMQDRFQQAMDPVAKLLGLSDDDLKSALQSGQSLAQIASAKGVSSSDLLSTVTQGLQAAGVSAPQGTDLTTLAQNLINQTGRGGHHRHHHHKPSADPSASGDGSGVTQALGSLASGLGMSQSDLDQSLQSGTSLIQLADQAGVSQESLAQLLGSTPTVDVTA